MADMENTETIAQTTQGAPAQPTETTWNKTEGEGGAINEGKDESSLESSTNSADAVIDATVKAVDELGVTVEDDKKEETKDEDKSDETAGEPDKKVEPEPDKKDEALEKALAKIAEIESQMADMADEKEEKRLEDERRKDREASDEDKAVRDALLNTPDEELTENELNMKKYIKSQDARMDRLESSLDDQSRSRTVEAFQKRFDKILTTHNKDGEEWLDENDLQTVARIARANNSNDIEGIAEALAEDNKAKFNKRLAKQSPKVISDYIEKKRKGKEDTPVVEKGGDAPPPDKTERLSMDKPAALKKSFIRDFLSSEGKKA